MKNFVVVSICSALSKLTFCLGLFYCLALSIPAQAQISGSSCLGANGGNSCTANDVSITNIVIDQITDACVGTGDKAIVNVTATVTAGSAQRYDVGLWIAEEGSSALTGTSCFRDWLPATSYPEEEGAKADACGTVVSNTSELRSMVGLSIPCQDFDPDGTVDFSGCTSWKNNSANDCPDILGALPQTGSKCRCEPSTVTGLPMPELALTKSCVPDEIAPGGTITCTVVFDNTAGLGALVDFHFEDNYDQTYGAVDDASISVTQGSATDDNDIITINTGTIAAGASVTLTYEFDVFDENSLPNGYADDTFSNVVDTFYTNSLSQVVNQNVQATEITSVPVTVSSVQIQQAGNGNIVFDWETQTETGNLGFNIYAYDASNDTSYKLNPQLIPSTVIDSTRTVAYTFVANQSYGAAQFVFEDMDVFGNLTKHGPFALGSSWKIPSGLLNKDIDWQAVRAVSNQKYKTRTTERAKKNKQTQTVLIGVSSDGVQRVTLGDLNAAGLELTSLAASAVSLSDGLDAVPVYVGSEGEEPFFEFIGEAGSTMYSNINYYTFSNTKPDIKKPVKNIKTSKNEVADIDTYTKHLKIAEANYYSFASSDENAWFDASVFAVFSPRVQAYSFDTSDASENLQSANIEIQLFGGLDFPEELDHHVSVSVGTTEIVEKRFDGFTNQTLNLSIPKELVNFSGDTVVNISVTSDTPRSIDIVYVKSIELSYKTKIESGDMANIVYGVNDNFAFYETDQQPASFVYKVAANEIARIEPSSNNSTERRVVKVDDSEAIYYVVNAGNVNVPTVSLPDAKAKQYSSANHLVIAHPDFMGVSLDDYLVQRAEYVSGNYEVINVKDIYAFYSDHELNAHAIREFIRMSASFGQLKSVLLIGGDTYDYNDNLGFGSVSFVPTNYAATSSLIKKAPTDSLLTDINNDGVSDIAIGRLPVRSTDELDNILDKTIKYFAKGPRKAAVLAADRNDINSGYSFVENSNRLASLMSDNGWTVAKAHLDGPLASSVADAKQLIISSINQGIATDNEYSDGVSLLIFNGHSGPRTWTFSNLFTINDAMSLQNENSPFVVLQWGCWNTYYVEPRQLTLGHAFMQSDSIGAAAVIGSTALSTADNQRPYSELLQKILVSENISIGDAINKSKYEYALKEPSAYDVTLGIALLGDPTLTLY